MSRRAIVWMGPVATANIAPAVAGTDVSILTVNGWTVAPDHPRAVAPSDFRPWVQALGSDPVGALCAMAHADEVWLAAFSAGAGALEAVLKARPADERVLGVLAADAYYGLAVKPGYLAHAKATTRPFWLTSSNARDVHTCAESVLPFADSLGLAPASPPPAMPPPIATRSSGPVAWLNYEGLYSHVQHATVLSPAALRSWVTGQEAPPPTPPEPWTPPEPGQAPEPAESLRAHALAAGAGAAVGGLTWWALSRLR